MLKVSMGNSLRMDVSHASGDLFDQVANLGFRQAVEALAFDVGEQITGLVELCHNVVSVFNCECFDERSDILTFLTELHGTSFGDAVFVLGTITLLEVHDFDGDLESRALVLGDKDGVAGAFADRVQQVVLLKLVLVALGGQHCKDSLLPLAAVFEENEPTLVLG